MSGSLAGLSIAWESFFRDTLPGLFSIEKWRAFWGGAWQNISDWWATRIQGIKDLIETDVKPVRDEVDKQASWWDTIKGLITDPLETILSWLLKVGKTHQGLLLKLFDKVMDALWG